ncbi:F-box/kelch-repeat protein At3g06240 [Linum perenne]
MKKSMVHKEFPEDIIVDIMSRLPVKPIVRFKCACKAWYKLFSQPFFIQMHFNRAISSGENSCLLLRHIAPEEKESSQWNKKRRELFVKAWEQGNEDVSLRKKRRFEENFSLRSKTTFEQLSKPQLPTRWRRSFTTIVGSNHGTVCIAETNEFDHKKCEDVALWNPATGESRLLPKLANGRSSCFTAALGFTFNPDINDYQVVSIVLPNSEPEFEAQVLSVSTNQWRSVDAEILKGTCLDFVSKANLGGILHWLAFKMEGDLFDDFIVWLDTTKDKFGVIEYPVGLDTQNKESLLHSHSRGSGKKESLLLFIFDSQKIPSCDIWFMQEYRQVSSWTKLYTMPMKFRMKPIGMYLHRNGEMLVERVEDDPDEGNIYACFMRNVSFKNLEARTPDGIFKHVETLVPIGQTPTLQLQGVATSTSFASTSDHP